MATENTATQGTTASSEKSSEDKYFALANSAYLDLFQIKAIAKMLNDHSAVNAADIDDDVAGGILAIVTIAEQACSRWEG